jgi:hypothetical protein
MRVFLTVLLVLGEMVACRADTPNKGCDRTPIASSGTLRACTARRIVGRGLSRQPSDAEQGASDAANALYKARHPARASGNYGVLRAP